MKNLKYQKPFGFHFRYCHQVDNHNNRKNYSISLERSWATKFWTDPNFVWYLYVMDLNTELASRHIQNGGNSMPNLDFHMQLALRCMENNIGTEAVAIGSPIQACRRPQIV